MTDESPLDADLRKGHSAQRLLDDPVLAGAFDSLRAEYLKAWEATTPRDTDARERYWQAYQIAGKVRTQLAMMASSGKLAQKQIDEIATLGERKRRFGIV